MQVLKHGIATKCSLTKSTLSSQSLIHVDIELWAVIYTYDLCIRDISSM